MTRFRAELQIYPQTWKNKFSSILKRMIMSSGHFRLMNQRISVEKYEKWISVLLAFIRFVKNEKFLNEFLFCKYLKNTTRGEDIFKLVNENILSFGLLWNYCVSVCTDGCPSMLGNKKGFVTLVCQQNPNIIIVHCMIHRESLASKSLPQDLLTVMHQVI